ncbi:Pyruvate/Phosphoenolpyruvate kinase-like domain-containing protein [Mycena rosella]|uniref:Pyruvate/Phosphoenolpyruvate kinase-like domain-containing protein n=1 Tax=Mycena rosella TaxID=1033263 RepID=A0AAD7CLY1_MYCRO|nr:Pyruvate/Phosphoenolpyruvate kinase-like domain-containing protein [Mycena rosella]
MTAPPQFTFDAASLGQFRPPTLQQASNLQALFKSGKVAVGTALSYPSRHVAKTLAVTGADWCWVDAEHSGGKMIPVVRVPSKTAFDYMAWCLDAGAGGIIIPHLETVEEMKAVIAACRFPPIGHRSFPPFIFIPGVTDTTPEGETVFSLANKHVGLIPQIESRLGIQNMEEIMKLEEVSAFMIGTGDLRLDMGLSLGIEGDEPEYVAAIQKATRVSKQRGSPIVGGGMGVEMLKKRMDEGYRFIVCCADLHTLAYGTIKSVGEARAAAEEYMKGIHGN